MSSRIDGSLATAGVGLTITVLSIILIRSIANGAIILPFGWIISVVAGVFGILVMIVGEGTLLTTIPEGSPDQKWPRLMSWGTLFIIFAWILFVFADPNSFWPFLFFIIGGVLMLLPVFRRYFWP